eukprot:7744191-Pyramimonas_sp.AAC.1
MATSGQSRQDTAGLQMHDHELPAEPPPPPDPAEEEEEVVVSSSVVGAEEGVDPRWADEARYAFCFRRRAL